MSSLNLCFYDQAYTIGAARALIDAAKYSAHCAYAVDYQSTANETHYFFLDSHPLHTFGCFVQIDSMVLRTVHPSSGLFFGTPVWLFCPLCGGLFAIGGGLFSAHHLPLPGKHVSLFIFRSSARLETIIVGLRLYVCV